jgi:hypothetical protein
MLQHIILDPEYGQDNFPLIFPDCQGKMKAEGFPWLHPNGTRTLLQGGAFGPYLTVQSYSTVQVFDHVVRDIKNQFLKLHVISVDCLDERFGKRMVEVLLEKFHTISLEKLLADERRFGDLPDLILMLAILARNNPDAKIIGMVKSLLESEAENARVPAAGAAAMLHCKELLPEVRIAAGHKDNSPKAQRVLNLSLRTLEQNRPAYHRTEPYQNAKETFQIHW